MFGKLMSISDTLMLRYYELLTTESLNRVKGQHPMEAKLALASLIVARYHGEPAAAQARDAFQSRVRDKEFPDEPDARVRLTRADVADPNAPARPLIDLVARTKFVPSKSEARRLIVQGGVELDGEKQTNA